MIVENSVTYNRPGVWQTAWMIAWRQVLDAVRDRSTLIMMAFFLALQTGLVLYSLHDLLQGTLSPARAGVASTMMAFFLLYAGVIPSAPAIGIASGVFAGDKERGSLSPMLVTPASNTAIFAGKVLGAILPALGYALLGIIVYFVEIALFFGADKLALLPVTLTIMIALLIPAITLFGASLASVISSRVATFQSAQNYSSLITTALWMILFVLVWTVNALGLWAFALAVVVVYALAIALVILASATWRREEVMARQ